MTTNTNAAPNLREKLINLIAQHLSGTYHCTRVWEAWNVGTMSEDDFEDVGESDTPTELADAILAELSTAAQPPAGWVMVPMEPTEEMIGAGSKKLGALYGHEGAKLCWHAQLAAAPNPHVQIPTENVHVDCDVSRKAEKVDMSAALATQPQEEAPPPIPIGSSPSPEFTGLPMRKLLDLLADGYVVDGVSFSNANRKGFITTGGFVGWWHGADAPIDVSDRLLADLRNLVGRGVLTDAAFKLIVAWAESAAPEVDASFWPVDGNASRKQLIHQIGQMNFRLTALRQENAGLIKRTKGQAEALKNHQRSKQAAPGVDAEDTARYRCWRDNMIAGNKTMRDVVAASLPKDCGLSRPPTALEWDAAIDAARKQEGK